MIYLLLFQYKILLLRSIRNNIEYSSYNFNLELNFKKYHDSDGIKLLFFLNSKLSSISNLNHKIALKNQAMQHPQNHKYAHLGMQLRRFVKVD